MSTAKKIIENDQDSKKGSTYDASKHRMCFGKIFENNNDTARLKMLIEEIDEPKDQKSKIEFCKNIIE